MNAACFCMTGAIRSMLGILSTKRMIEHETKLVSFDAPASVEDDTLLHELIADPNAEDPAEAACRADKLEAVRAAVAELPEDERALIRRVYFDGEIWPKDPRMRRCLEAGMRALRRSKRLRCIRDDLLESVFRHKGIAPLTACGAAL